MGQKLPALLLSLHNLSRSGGHPSGPWLAHLYGSCVSPAGEVAPVWDQECPSMWGDPVSTLPLHCEQPCQIRS